MEPKTITELMIAHHESEHYQRVKQSLAIVLEFVERWNKQDKEQDVAKAAMFLETLIKH